MKVGVLVGSLRRESFSKKIAKNVKKLFPETYEVEMIEIGHLPFYNQDFDDDNEVPESFVQFRKEMMAFDAFLFVTPEYNRSVPAVLKNALDVGSRPKTDNVWNGKPAAIISQSPGNLGGFGANHHLRQTLTCLNMPVVQQPEMYLSKSAQLLDADGKMNNESTVIFLQGFVDVFVGQIENHA